MHLFEICVLFSNHDNYRWNEEWQGSEPDVFITLVSDHRRGGCGRSADARQCMNLSVWRSTEVKRFPDLVTHRSDLTTLSIACARDKGTTGRWREKIKEQAALVMTWKVSFLGGQARVKCRFYSLILCVFTTLNGLLLTGFLFCGKIILQGKNQWWKVIQ